MAISGKTGNVNGTSASVVSWSIDIETDLLDATDFASAGWKQHIEGLKGASGSLTALQRFSSAATISLVNASNTYSGSVIFNGEAVETAVADRVTYTHRFTFTGSVGVS